VYNPLPENQEIEMLPHICVVILYAIIVMVVI